MDLRPPKSDVERLLGDLVSIDSTNPSLVPGAAGEKEIAGFVSSWLQQAGLEVDTPDALPDRPNVVARLSGPQPGRAIMFNAHVDTVGITGMSSPHAPRVEGDRLYGRGAYDMKSGLAAVMLAARTLAEAGWSAGEVIVAAVADEEYASAGTEQIVRDLSADGAIVTEPTGLRICVAHKGFAWLEVEARGRAAHGSKPELGIDAIARMGRVLSDIDRLSENLASSRPHPLLGTGSIHASLIEGGQELSSYPERCVLKLERRTIPGETSRAVASEIEAILAALSTEDREFEATSKLLFWREPFEVSADEAIVQAVETAATDVLGTAPELYGDTPWMDAALLSAAGIPTVVFGPGGAGAHAVEEWASIEQTALCAEVLARAALSFCSSV